MDLQEINFVLNYLDNNRKFLTSLQNEFLASLKKNYEATGVLTQRQVESLQDLKEYIPSLIMDKSEVELPRAQYSTYDNLSVYNI